MTAHKHAALMLQYAKDAMETDKPWERWEWRDIYHDGDDTPWKQLSFHPVWHVDSEFRRKPQTIKIGKWEFPKPISSPPRDEETYWIVRAYFHTKAGHVPDPKTWYGDEADYGYLKINICHLSKEAAQAHADALNAICRGDVE